MERATYIRLTDIRETIGDGAPAAQSSNKPRSRSQRNYTAPRGHKLPLSNHEVYVAGKRVSYATVGKGEPLVLVHGLSGSSRWWTPVLPYLAAHYRVYLVDLPGFGTARRSRPRLLVRGAAEWLSAWMQAIGIGSAYIVGHSMGGYISLGLTARSPHLVRGLVLVSPAVIPSRVPLPKHVLALLSEARHLRFRFLPVLLRDALLAGPFSLWQGVSQLMDESAFTYAEAISAPTLLVWGEHDRLVPPALGHILDERLQNSRLLVLRGAGHVPMVDRPETFAEAVMRFLQPEPYE